MKPRFVIVMLLIIALAVPATMVAQGSKAEKDVRVNDELPPRVILIPPDQIKWVKTPSGRERAELLGDWTKPGLYINLIRACVSQLFLDVTE